MIKVSRIVDQIVRESDFVEFAIKNDILNLTEYARFIKEDVEKKTLKKVEIGTIVVALSRLKKSAPRVDKDKKSFYISEISIKSPLCEIVYDLTDENLKTLKKIYNEINFGRGKFLTVTQSNTEIMITFNSKLKDKIADLFMTKPKLIFEDLVGISIHFPEDFTDEPNIFYGILRSFAWKNISVVDVISTYSEFTIIIRGENKEKAFEIINGLYNV